MARMIGPGAGGRGPGATRGKSKPRILHPAPGSEARRSTAARSARQTSNAPGTRLFDYAVANCGFAVIFAAAALRASALSVFSQVKASPLRPKWPWVAVAL
jgi:hypothetical protein